MEEQSRSTAGAGSVAFDLGSGELCDFKPCRTLILKIVLPRKNTHAHTAYEPAVKRQSREDSQDSSLKEMQLETAKRPYNTVLVLLIQRRNIEIIRKKKRVTFLRQSAEHTDDRIATYTQRTAERLDQ